jgi:hypothetical protein
LKTQVWVGIVQCGKELENKEKEEHIILPGENELQHVLLSTQGREDQLSSVLPEVAVLPCTHVFHLTYVDY